MIKKLAEKVSKALATTDTVEVNKETRAKAIRMATAV